MDAAERLAGMKDILQGYGVQYGQIRALQMEGVGAMRVSERFVNKIQIDSDHSVL